VSWRTSSKEIKRNLSFSRLTRHKFSLFRSFTAVNYIVNQSRAVLVALSLEFRTCDQEIVGLTAICTVNLGKLFTRFCLCRQPIMAYRACQSTQVLADMLLTLDTVLTLFDLFGSVQHGQSCDIAAVAGGVIWFTQSRAVRCRLVVSSAWRSFCNFWNPGTYVLGYSNNNTSLASVCVCVCVCLMPVCMCLSVCHSVCICLSGNVSGNKERMGRWHQETFTAERVWPDERSVW